MAKSKSRSSLQPAQSAATTASLVQVVQALTDDSTRLCAWSGEIEITDPGSAIDVD